MNEANVSELVTRKHSCDIFNDNSNPNYNLRNEIIYYTKVLKSNLCDYNKTWSDFKSFKHKTKLLGSPLVRTDVLTLELKK